MAHEAGVAALFARFWDWGLRSVDWSLWFVIWGLGLSRVWCLSARQPEGVTLQPWDSHPHRITPNSLFRLLNKLKHPAPYTQSPSPKTLNPPKPQTPNPKPQTPSPKPQTPNPELERGGPYQGNPQPSTIEPSFGALAGRLASTIRRHKFNEDARLIPAGRALEGGRMRGGGWMLPSSGGRGCRASWLLRS